MQNKNWRNNNQRRNSSQNNNSGGNRPGGGHRHNNNQNGGGFRPRNDRPRFKRPPQREVETPAEVKFYSGSAIDPAPRIYLEKGLAEPTIRAMDLVSPIGKGQRGLIVSPPKSGKTTFLKHITQAITKAEPEMKVYVLLIDERPEEVPDFRRSVTADVRWSTSDQPYENHI